MTDPTTEVDRRTKFTAGLRALADWYDTHPDFPLPYCSVSLWVYPDEFAARDWQAQHLASTLALTGTVLDPSFAAVCP